MKRTTSKRYLFEIGVEEIPSIYLEDAEQIVARAFESLFTGQRIRFDKIDVYVTPRRLSAVVTGLASSQTEEEQEFVGPSESIAFDAQGQPTKALEGFLRSNGLKKEDLFTKETPKGPKVAAKKTMESKSTLDIFPELLVDVVSQIQFPKMMRWNDSQFKFVRPIRWLVSLWGEKVVPCQIAGLKSDRLTYGHRFLSNKPITLKSAEEYEKKLSQSHVILSLSQRKELTREVIAAAEKEQGFVCGVDAGLLNVVSNLVEEPFVVTGSFDKQYLTLPQAVLSTCMRRHQKVFACFDKKGKLVPKFLGISNGARKNMKVIQKDYENVLESRLRDAKFFYQEDTKTPLSSKLEKLADVTFLKGMGSVLDRTNRLVSLSEYLAQTVKLNSTEIEQAKRAAQLCKADLVTQMVYEFPELQGTIGAEYARHDGEDERVAIAIERHYLPLSLSEPVEIKDKNKEIIGAILGICDKIDILVSAYGSGIELKGSEDPFALRRAAGGLVKLTLAYDLRYSLQKLIEFAYQQLAKATMSQEEVVHRLMAVFKDRIQFELSSSGLSRTQQEILAAVLASQWQEITDVVNRHEQLCALEKRESDTFFNACKVVERAHNILKSGKGNVSPRVETSLLSEDAEKKLYSVIEKNNALIQDLIQKAKYEDALLKFGRVYIRPVDRFFDEVLVNADDLKVRANRYALLEQLSSDIINRCADLSKIESVVSIRLAKAKV